MTVVSYAQNLEDIMLWRALQHVENGFYIDVGACSPNVDSVTKLFYERGWNGVNIEPEPSYYTEFIQQRPRDISLRFVLSNKPSHLEIYFVKDRRPSALGNSTGSSTLNINLAEELAAQGFLIEIEKVEAITLANVYERYIPASQEVHFLKIDVEGAEKEVLEGNEWQRYQPWIVLAESISPNNRKENYQNWEHLLISAGYCFVYSDQLNRFYVSPKHPELRAAFRYPPNLFDEFIIHNHLTNVLAKNQEIYDQFIEVNATVNALLTSRSWKITSPLRTLSSVIRSFFYRLKKALLPFSNNKLGGNKCKN